MEWLCADQRHGKQDALRVTFDGNGGAKPAERWNVGHRVRDVEVAPDGAVWMLEDDNPGGVVPRNAEISPGRSWISIDDSSSRSRPAPRRSCLCGSRNRRTIVTIRSACAATSPPSATACYLNSAYIAPIPLPVAEAARAFADRKTSKPIPLGEMLQKTDEVRGQFARLVGAEPDEIGFLFATSEGENIVAAALDLKAGDNVVIDELHYETSFVLYRHLEETRRIALRIVKHRDGASPSDDFAKAVDDRTRLVSVAWVSHQNGFRHDMRPIADLAHAHGALFYTDAVQALGMFPANVRAAGVDFMTSGTYKWLLGGFGVAPFFVRRELLDRIRVDRLGALHVEKELRRPSLRDLPDGEEVRIRHAALCRGLPARRGARVPRARRRRPDRAPHRGAGPRAARRTRGARLPAC